MGGRGSDPEAYSSTRLRPGFPGDQADEPHHRGRRRELGCFVQDQGKDPIVGQKINPHGFRLGVTTDFKSRWYADKAYKDYVKEDVAIRWMLISGMGSAGIFMVVIEITSDCVCVARYIV